MKLHTIHSGYFKLDGGAMHGVVPKSMWQKANPADEQNMCTWAMRCLLIEDGDRLMLIDTGMGNKQDEKFFSFFQPHGDESLQGSLHRAGFGMNDITDVFLTHLHFDHGGGAVKREQETLMPAFPNATYWSHRQHWESALHPNVREKASFLKENILPLQESGQLHLLDSQDGDSFTDYMRIRIVQGHTDYMMLPQIDYKGKTILYTADLVPSLPHISLPWVMAYDMRPLDTLREKATLLQEIADVNGLLFFEHDPRHELCRLEQTDRGIRSGEVLRLTELS